MAQKKDQIIILPWKYISCTLTNVVNEIPMWAWKFNTLRMQRALGLTSLSLKWKIFSSLVNSAAWGQSTGWSHSRDPTGHSSLHPSAVLPRPLLPFLSFLLLSYRHLFSRSEQTHLQDVPSSAELNMTIICLVFLLFPFACAVTLSCSITGPCKWKILCHFLYKGLTAI